MERLRYQCVDCVHNGVDCLPYQRYSKIEEINECEDYVGAGRSKFAEFTINDLQSYNAHLKTKED